MQGEEARLQSEIIKWLKSVGVYVIKTKAGPGTPVGCPDVFGFYSDKWLAIEVKASITSKLQIGQKETLQRLKEGNQFVYLAYPQNWQGIKNEILAEFLSI